MVNKDGRVEGWRSGRTEGWKGVDKALGFSGL